MFSSTLYVIVAFDCVDFSISLHKYVVYSQDGNQTSQGVREQAQEKIFQLTEKFNQVLKDSGVNLTLPRDGDLAAKLKELADNNALKSLSEKFKAAVEELRGNATINIGVLK